MTNPRFRTAHDAGKYISAMAYPAARELKPEEFGAVPEAILNPAYQYAQFEVRGNEIIDLHAPQPAPKPTLRTSEAWYKEYAANGRFIIFADGWDDLENFNDYWYYEPITREEFDKRFNKSVVYA